MVICKRSGEGLAAVQQMREIALSRAAVAVAVAVAVSVAVLAALLFFGSKLQQRTRDACACACALQEEPEPAHEQLKQAAGAGGSMQEFGRARPEVWAMVRRRGCRWMRTEELSDLGGGALSIPARRVNVRPDNI